LLSLEAAVVVMVAALLVAVAAVALVDFVQL
jgi:hypothetical protein